MAVRKIIIYPDAKLVTKSDPICKFDEALKNLSTDLIDTMYEADGVGLAAPQLGINKRIFVMDCSENKKEKNYKIIINPRIEHYSQEINTYKEGCLSIPGITEEISRPKVISVSYQTINGVTQKDIFDDLWSICFQHEFDHLEGKLFIDYLRPLKKALIKKKIKKSLKKEAKG